jgi:Tol biopolymer transport system component
MRIGVGPGFRTFAAFSGLAVSAILATTTLLAGPAAASTPGGNGQLAFVRNGNIYTSAATGTGPLHQLTTAGGTHPEWSADGTQLVFEQGGSVWTMNADGTGKVKHWPGSAASWSPDGTTLAYLAPDVSNDLTCGGGPAVVTRKLSGGAPHVLEFDTMTCSGNPPSFTNFNGDTTSWSADGTRVLFSYTIPNGGFDGPNGKFIPWEGWSAVVEFDLTAPYPDPSSGSWIWPPEGSRAVRTWCLGKAQSFCEAAAVGGGKQVVTAQVDYAPSRPNFVFASNVGATDGKTRLWVYGRLGGYRQQISTDTSVSYPMYSPNSSYVYYTQGTGATSKIRRVALGQAKPPVTVLTNASQAALQPLP